MVFYTNQKKFLYISFLLLSKNALVNKTQIKLLTVKNKIKTSKEAV